MPIFYFPDSKILIIDYDHWSLCTAVYALYTGTPQSPINYSHAHLWLVIQSPFYNTQPTFSSKWPFLRAASSLSPLMDWPLDLLPWVQEKNFNSIKVVNNIYTFKAFLMMTPKTIWNLRWFTLSMKSHQDASRPRTPALCCLPGTCLIVSRCIMTYHWLFILLSMNVFTKAWWGERTDRAISNEGVLHKEEFQHLLQQNVGYLMNKEYCQALAQNP